MTATTKSSTSSPASCCYADLVLWKDVQKSAVIFSSVMLVLYLLQNYTVLGLVAYSMWMVTTCCCLWVLIKNVISAFQHQQGQTVSAAHPFQYILDYLPSKLLLSEEQLTKSIPQLTAFVNKYISMVIKLILVDSWFNSSILVITLYFTRGILASYSILCLATTIWIALFTLPYVYKLKQKEIDDVVEKVKAPIVPHIEKVQGMVKKFQLARKATSEDTSEDKQD